MPITIILSITIIALITITDINAMLAIRGFKSESAQYWMFILPCAPWPYWYSSRAEPLFRSIQFAWKYPFFTINQKYTIYFTLKSSCIRIASQTLRCVLQSKVLLHAVLNSYWFFLTEKNMTYSYGQSDLCYTGTAPILTPRCVTKS